MQLGLWRLNLICGAAVLAGLLGLAIFAGSVPSFSEVRSQYRPSDSWILDRDGVPLESIRESADKRMLSWIPWSEVSPSFQRQLVEVEDQRFYRHFGVDPLALAHATTSLLQNAVGYKKLHRGASTLTMQLTKFLPPASSAKTANAKSWTAKIDQIFLALRLERTWQKSEILEAYINLVPFRGELVGLSAASFGLFAKSPAALNDIESALLIASIRAPNATVDVVANRACHMRPLPECDQIRTVAQRNLGHAYRIARSRERVPILSSLFVSDSVVRPGVVQTTLINSIQTKALEAVREQLAQLKDRNVQDAAVVVLETKTGKPVAYIGNGGPDSTSGPQIDGVNMRRQAGSTLKPFVYATAFDMRLLQISSLVQDAAEDFAVGSGSVYSPRDYDPVFQGYVSAAEALASSLNVPAVRTLLLVKESRVLDRMHELGFTQLKEDDHYGPSLALGTVDVTLYELTQGYRQLSLYANSSIFKNETKSDIFASLSRPEYRRFTFGLDSVLALPFPAAVKTGTSKDLRDNWCIGFTSEYTVGVWVGNFDGSSMWNVSGLTGAAPIWRKLMIALHPTPPKDQMMDFVKPATLLLKHSLSQIRYPQKGMLIGLDPDIPHHLQKLPIKVEHPQADQTIFVDGKTQGAAQENMLWSLIKGRHHVELRARSGVVVDKVDFRVR